MHNTLSKACWIIFALLEKDGECKQIVEWRLLINLCLFSKPKPSILQKYNRMLRWHLPSVQIIIDSTLALSTRRSDLDGSTHFWVPKSLPSVWNLVNPNPWTVWCGSSLGLVLGARSEYGHLKLFTSPKTLPVACFDLLHQQLDHTYNTPSIECF